MLRLGSAVHPLVHIPSAAARSESSSLFMRCTGTLLALIQCTRQLLRVIELSVAVHRVHLWCTGHQQLYAAYVSTTITR